MNTPSPTTPVPEEIVAAIESGARRLHGIASRSDAVQIASEVLRLNDAVRAAARSRLHSADQPQDFAAALLALADSTHEGGTP